MSGRAINAGEPAARTYALLLVMESQLPGPVAKESYGFKGDGGGSRSIVDRDHVVVNYRRKTGNLLRCFDIFDVFDT